MPGHEAVAEAARGWIRRADVDVATARKVIDDREGVDPWVVAFHAQQGAEKALKAALTFEQIRSPRSHELERLATLLSADWGLPHARELARLSRYALSGRYPGAEIDAGPEPDWDDAAHALRLAERVAASVRDGMGRRETPPLAAGLGVSPRRDHP